MIGTSMFVEHPIPESNISIDVMNGSWTLCCSLRRWHAILSRAAREKLFWQIVQNGELTVMTQTEVAFFLTS